MKSLAPISVCVLISLSLVLVTCTSAPVGDPGDPERISPEVDPTVIAVAPPELDAVPGSLHGFVVDEGGPIHGALVRMQATENKVWTNPDGEFTLTGLPLDEPVTVTAWAEGYFVNWIEDALSVATPVTIELKPYYSYDNPDYDWFSHEGDQGSLSCSHCMPCYEEWQADAHSRSALNERFLSMYNGTDLDGNQSPLTRYAVDRDYGRIPVRPDLNKPYFGPGYKLDFPQSAGNCATCHVPAQAAHPGLAYAADPNEAQGIELEGVFCEFCHKIGGVVTNPESGLPFADMPGVLSMRLFRPQGDDQLFFGNFDDVTRRVSRLPLMEKSEYCAPCHFGVFWDVVVYNSFGEWLESPYSDPLTGRTCQDCHMPPVDYDYFVDPENGGLIRDRSRIFSHQMPGVLDEAFMQSAVSMQVNANRMSGEVLVEVVITNDNTGHKVPTDSPLRHMILTVEAFDEQGTLLEQLKGPVVPDWGGVGERGQGYLAGTPGKGYALILRELWTNVSPTGAYWNPVVVESDSRLGPFESDLSTYVFSADEDAAVDLRVQLIYRRAFKELMIQKGWSDADILIKDISISLPID